MSINSDVMAHLKLLIHLLIISLGTAMSGCTKSSEDPIPNRPIKLITTVDSITPVSVLISLKIDSFGFDKGVFLATTPHPTENIHDIQQVGGVGIYDIVYEIRGLKPMTKYYARSYADSSGVMIYGNELSFTTPDLTLGDRFWNGVVFYIDSTSQHGLLAATEDQGSIGWFNGSYQVTGAISTKNGYLNTKQILDTLGFAVEYAAMISALDMGLYGEDFTWFLPAKEQLGLLFINRSFVGNLSSNSYWSSTETSDKYAWSQDFATGYQLESDKAREYSVRAITPF